MIVILDEDEKVNVADIDVLSKANLIVKTQVDDKGNVRYEVLKSRVFSVRQLIDSTQLKVFILVRALVHAH